MEQNLATDYIEENSMWSFIWDWDDLHFYLLRSNIIDYIYDIMFLQEIRRCGQIFHISYVQNF